MNKKMIWKRIGKVAVWALLCWGVTTAAGQQPVLLTLDRAISLATDSSLAAFRMRNVYLSGYWEFRNYKAERLPSLTLYVTPAQYNRDMT